MVIRSFGGQTAEEEFPEDWEEAAKELKNDREAAIREQEEKAA